MYTYAENLALEAVYEAAISMGRRIPGEKTFTFTGKSNYCAGISTKSINSR